MKKMKSSSKLNLEKIEISKLNNFQATQIWGGKGLTRKKSKDCTTSEETEDDM